MKSARHKPPPPSLSSPQKQHGPQSTTSIKLNPTAVRERAKSVPGCREVLADGPTVLSFIVGLHGTKGRQRPKDLARVNIWTDTGTVGTSRVINGKVRQSFRRHVQRYVCAHVDHGHCIIRTSISAVSALILRLRTLAFFLIVSFQKHDQLKFGCH